MRFTNPVIISLSLTFWGWMWGIVGIILAVRILAAFKIFCAHIKPMEPIGEFLSKFSNTFALAAILEP